MEDRLVNLEGKVVFADPAQLPLDTLIKVTRRGRIPRGRTVSHYLRHDAGAGAAGALLVLPDV